MNKKKSKTAQLKELQRRWRVTSEASPDTYPRPTGPITVDGKKRRWT